MNFYLGTYNNNFFIENFITNDFKNTSDNSFENYYKISRKVDKIFWKLPFNPTSKGTLYLKYAVYIAYFNQELLFDNKKLVKLISEKINIESKVVRSFMDKSINSMFRYVDERTLDNLFYNIYDGRKPSTKYFIVLCVNLLNKNTGLKEINMYQFI